MIDKSTCIQLFAKAPVAGKVKTRLARHIGNERAAEIAISLFNEMLTRCQQVARTECWVGGEPLNHSGLDLCEKISVPRFAQQGNTLGEKMCFAMEQGLQKAQRVLIVGGDCLGVTETVLKNAITTLKAADQVFVPAEDGGFVVWGVSRFPDKNQFDTIAWGTPDVWEQTQQRLSELNLNYKALDSAWDVDEVEDLERVKHLL